MRCPTIQWAWLRQWGVGEIRGADFRSSSAGKTTAAAWRFAIKSRSLECMESILTGSGRKVEFGEQCSHNGTLPHLKPAHELASVTSRDASGLGHQTVP